MHGLWRAAPRVVTSLSASQTLASAVIRAASAQDVTDEKPRVTVFGTGLMGVCLPLKLCQTLCQLCALLTADLLLGQSMVSSACHMTGKF